MLNWLLRYQPVIEIINDLQPDSVLDVGSGKHGLSWYMPRDVVQTDLAFPDVEPDSSRVGSATYVAARAEALPFRVDAFDVSISLDLLEHMPAGARPDAIRELCRVARRAVIIGFPVGEPARRLDRVLSRYWKIRGRAQATPDWLQEHLEQEEYPSNLLVESTKPDGWRVSAVRKSGNVWLQGTIVLAEWTPLFAWATHRLETRQRQRPSWRLLDRGATYRTIWVLEPTEA